MCHTVAKCPTLEAAFLCHCHSESSKPLGGENIEIFVADIAVVTVRHTLQPLKGSRMALTMHAVPHPEGKVLKQQLFFFFLSMINRMN